MKSPEAGTCSAPGTVRKGRAASSPSSSNRRPPTVWTTAVAVLAMLLVASPWTIMARSYRHIYVNNADVCRKETPGNPFSKLLSKVQSPEDQPSSSSSSSSELYIGTGAAIFQLSDPSKSLQPEYRKSMLAVCEIRVRAPEGYGLFAHVEEMFMRQSAKDGSCVDSIQFGQDDAIPFITLEKSGKICGELGDGGGGGNGRQRGGSSSRSGFYYNDPEGNLLIWITLGGRRQTSHWPIISKVNLTLVVTAYRKDCSGPGWIGGRPLVDDDPKKYRRCSPPGSLLALGSGKQNTAASGPCILKDYFCDRHFNCPPDLRTGEAPSHLQVSTTFDENGCTYENLDQRSRGGDDAYDDDDDDDGDAMDLIGGMNLISWCLIVVSVVFMVVLFFIVVARARKGRPCCCCSDSYRSCADSGGGDEYGQHRHQVQSLAELSAGGRRRHVANAESNIYLPLTVIHHHHHETGRNETAAVDGDVADDGGISTATNLDHRQQRPPQQHDRQQPTQPENLSDSLDQRPVVVVPTPALVQDFPEEPPPAYSELFPERKENVRNEQRVVEDGDPPTTPSAAPGPAVNTPQAEPTVSAQGS